MDLDDNSAGSEIQRKGIFSCKSLDVVPRKDCKGQKCMQEIETTRGKTHYLKKMHKTDANFNPFGEAALLRANHLLLDPNYQCCGIRD